MGYKLRGQHHFNKAVVEGFRDSVIFLENDVNITFSDIKALRLRKNGSFLITLRRLFFRAGVGFVFLNTFNNGVVFHRYPVLDPKAVEISAGFLLGSIIMDQLSIKRVRINKNNYLMILDFNFNGSSIKK